MASRAHLRIESYLGDIRPSPRENGRTHVGGISAPRFIGGASSSSALPPPVYMNGIVLSVSVGLIGSPPAPLDPANP